MPESRDSVEHHHHVINVSLPSCLREQMGETTKLTPMTLIRACETRSTFNQAASSGCYHAQLGAGGALAQ